MPFHEHSLTHDSLVLRQLNLYCHYGLSKSQHLVHAHLDVCKFQYPLQFLVHLQCNEAYTDMGFYPATCEVEHRTYLNLRFGNAESPFHIPKVVICGIYLFSRYRSVGQVSFQSVP